MADLSQNPCVLIVHPGALGDVILSLKAIRALRCWFSTHDVLLVSRADIGVLLRDAGEVDCLWPLEGPTFSQLLAGQEYLNSKTRLLLNRCTHAVCWMGSENGTLLDVLQCNGIKEVIIRSPKDETLSAHHTEDRFLETLLPWGVSIEPTTRPLLGRREQSF